MKKNNPNNSSKELIYFPYGVSNFEKISRQNYIFVDKTNYIEILEQQSESHVSFLRPRRFGKSLWLSVLEYYYDINQKHQFEQLFGKYYIGKNPTNQRNSYRILKFDFSGINTESRESTKQGFNSNIQSTLDGFFKIYKCFSTEEIKKISDEIDAEEKMTKFFKYYTKDIPIYMLFDEYDHFTNDVLYRDKEEFIDSVSKQGYIRKFYEVIKTATQQGVVDKLFITGVSPVTLDALTSGFNILKHISHREEFETMMGFTEEEVRNLLQLVLEDKSREDEVISEMREWYNGYRFYEESTQSVYNSDMVLYYLDYFKKYQKSPKRMLDPNIAPDYGKIKQMFEVIDVGQNQEVLQEVLEKGYVTAPLIEQFNFERGFGRTEFINFLAYMGSLTIDSVDFTGRIKYKIPNRVIKELYWQYYADRLNAITGLKTELIRIDRAIENMARDGEYKGFFNLIERVLKELSNRDYIQFSEKQVKMVIMAYLMLADIFYIKSEDEIKSGGYADLLLFNKPSNPPHHQYVIELKYLKKEEKNQLETVQKEAREQLLAYYEKDKALQQRPNLHLLTIVAVKDELYVEEVK